MAYPPDPLSYVVELFLNDSWRDVTTDLLYESGITIKRGRPDQSVVPSPGSCGFVLKNMSGDYSPRWPTGQWYGSIGQNTPLRIAVVASLDTFTRTVSNGWDTDDSGHAWTSGGSGGTVAAGDHNVGAGVGTQSVPVANAYRYDYLSAVSSRCVDVCADVSLSFSDVTVASVYPCGIMLRGQDTSTYYLVRTEITTTEAVTIGVYLADGTEIAAPVTVDGLTHSSSQTLRIRAQAEGHTIMAKVWASTADEPYGWQTTVHDEAIEQAGFVGIRSGVATGNTNSKPIVFSIDNVTVKVPLFAGEISDMPASWDESGNFVTVSVTGGGPLRRAGQGLAIQSTLKRGYLRDLDYPPLAYWPCEDLESSRLYFSPAVGDVPLWIISGTPSFASIDTFDCSEPLPGVNLSAWRALIPKHTPGRCQVRFLVSIPSGGLGIGLRRLMVIAQAGGSVGNISVFVDQNGNASIIVYATDNSVLYNSGALAAGLNGVPQQLAVEFEQRTATKTNVNLLSLVPGAGSVIEVSPTGVDLPLTQTIGFTTSLVVNPDYLLPDSVGIGHISFHTSSQTLLNLSSQLDAWTGEAAGERIERLGNEERFPVSYIGTIANSEPMGPQGAKTLLALIQECAVADMGELYESRGELGLTYRTRSSLCNQDAAITLDYSVGILSPPLIPADGDNYLRNDITVTRVGGSNARAYLATGRLSVLPPYLGGSGRYDGSVTVNVAADTQLPDLAGWLLNLGTVDEARYPVIKLDLANARLVAADLQLTATDLEIGDRLVITNPKPKQAVGDISQLVSGYEINASRFTFTLKYNCVPESPYQVGVLDDAGKRLDSDNTTLTSDITSGATSLSASISSGALWTVDAAEFPLEITMGGEIISVGAITGATSPQTFSSLTRSVNGVVKAHLAGTAIRVAHPFVLE